MLKQMIDFEIWLKIWKFHLMVNLERITLTRINNGLFYQVFEVYFKKPKHSPKTKAKLNSELDSIPF